MKKTKLKRKTNHRLYNPVMLEIGDLSSGLGRIWKQRKLAKGKDNVRFPVVSGGLPSLGRRK